MRFAVFFHVFMLSMKVKSIVILNFHWDLLYIVDMSECEKGSFWEVSVPKTSAAAIFSGDLYIFAKYAPVFSNRAFPTTFASHRHCHVRTYVQMRSFNFCSFSGQDVNWSGTLALVIRQHESMVRKYVNVITPPHPTPPLRDVTHLQHSMTYVRTCKWTCRGVTSWERASTWTLLPDPTPPHPKEHIKKCLKRSDGFQPIGIDIYCPWKLSGWLTWTPQFRLVVKWEHMYNYQHGTSKES